MSCTISGRMRTLHFVLLQMLRMRRLFSSSTVGMANRMVSISQRSTSSGISSVVPMISMPMMERPTFSGASSTQQMMFISGDLFFASSCSSVLAASPAPMSSVRRLAFKRFFSVVLRYMRYVRREYSVRDDANIALRK